jgi:hypothetical protein
MPTGIISRKEQQFARMSHPLVQKGGQSNKNLVEWNIFQ